MALALVLVVVLVPVAVLVLAVVVVLIVVLAVVLAVCATSAIPAASGPCACLLSLLGVEAAAGGGEVEAGREEGEEEGEEEVEEEEEGGVVILTLLPSPQLLSPSNQKRLPMLVVAVVVILTLLLLEVEVRVVELIAVMQVVMLVARQVASPPQLQEKGQCLGGEVRVGCWRVCWDRARRVRTAMFPPRHKQRHPQVRAITFRDNLSYQPHTHPINHEPLPYHLIRAPITPLRKQLHPQVRAITYRDNIPC